ncbi:hypothetical protein LZ30DRAFT_317039 [Colletotrichum cereale]|nr:hypothetical protein LZ30DRAFT_317039 [Colletotrichum cereale]
MMRSILRSKDVDTCHSIACRFKRELHHGLMGRMTDGRQGGIKGHCRGWEGRMGVPCPSGEPWPLFSKDANPATLVSFTVGDASGRASWASWVFGSRSCRTAFGTVRAGLACVSPPPSWIWRRCFSPHGEHQSGAMKRGGETEGPSGSVEWTGV